jgi:hypothetical protein
MKCPKCGVWSSVLATRGAARRRQCGNGHRFNTTETVTGVAHGGRHVQHWARNQAIRTSARSNSELAREHGISEARVRQIRNST